jgi:hypothetical protein
MAYYVSPGNYGVGTVSTMWGTVGNYDYYANQSQLGALQQQLQNQQLPRLKKHSLLHYLIILQRRFITTANFALL